MSKRITALASSALACALAAVFFTPSPASALGEPIQLDEIKILGSNGQTDEVVVIRNRSANTVDISNYRFVVRSNTNSPANVHDVPASTSLAPLGVYVVATSQYSGTGLTVNAPNTTLGIDRQGGVEILDNSNPRVVQDKVAFRDTLAGTGTGATTSQEGLLAETTSPNPNPDDLVHRKGTDTDQNEADWTLAPSS